MISAANFIPWSGAKSEEASLRSRWSWWTSSRTLESICTKRRSGAAACSARRMRSVLATPRPNNNGPRQRDGAQPQGQNELSRKPQKRKAGDKAGAGTVRVESTTPTTHHLRFQLSQKKPSVNALLVFRRRTKLQHNPSRANSSAPEAPVVISEATSTVTAAASTVEAVTELPEEPSARRSPNRCLQGQNVFKQIAVKSPGHHRTAPQGLKGKRRAAAGKTIPEEPAEVPGIQVRCTRHAR